MAPIRLGIIGLSSSAVTSWASSAHLPYLLSARGRSKYTIAALCNSSVESAKKAIESYGLDPASTRAYGDPTALASDPHVDLVVCCTRVDTHYDLAKPSVDAGKHVFVEWPLTHDVERSRELADAAAERGLHTMVGLQGRLTPVFLKIKELIQGGSLGKVLSSEVRAFGGTIDRETVAEGLKYFAQRSVGGNIPMIGFAHLFDSLQSTLGEATEVQTHLQLQRPTVKLRDASGKIVGEVASDVPDLIIAASSLKPSDSVEKGASLYIRFRRGQQFKGEPALTWHINCELGEIRVVSPSGTSLHANSYSAPVTIDVHDFATDEIRREEWEWPAWQEETDLPIVARSVAALYEGFYDHVSEGRDKNYPDFSDALSRHEQLSSMLSGWTSASRASAH
ncbi:NAD(P)-binding protein [Cryphonectria parasitica EP155]|uniref:NAD(P)-binding protein n=1 Tax=Cryphonectria parasitica (strain ATCC 38755 / EP155) TaxID=660469 RepID=A0A9P4Y2B4_CRYP1|nr:NAD(P)-binding protein [Cryphonectria parasitica EP155]KAF3765697.1 NAD(P)-binding protein [Cryphonectria parasitica EP155]